MSLSTREQTTQVSGDIFGPSNAEAQVEAEIEMHKQDEHHLESKSLKELLVKELRFAKNSLVKTRPFSKPPKKTSPERQY